MTHSRAEQELRAAFERLKSGRPIRVHCDAPLSQNNVAREAGKDPSCFKKTRYPMLIADIQDHLAQSCSPPTTSKRQALETKRAKNRKLRDVIRDITAERDHALSLLASADNMILELHKRIADLEAQLPPTNIRSLRPTGGR